MKIIISIHTIVTILQTGIKHTSMSRPSWKHKPCQTNALLPLSLFIGLCPMIPPVRVLDDWRGSAAVTLHRCHSMTDSRRVRTYLARPCNTYERTGQGQNMVWVFPCRPSWHRVRFLWVVRPTPNERVVFWGRKTMTWHDRAAFMNGTESPVSGSGCFQVCEAV